MKIFHCDHCGQLVFFENTRCVSCDRLLAYLPDVGEMCSLEPTGDGLWRALASGARVGPYRLCANYTAHNICNWGLPASEPHDRCRACRLTRVIPDLTIAGNEAAWYRLEVAKRRMVYTLLAFHLPIVSKYDDPDAGLAFDFLSDAVAGGTEPVLTGHKAGVITINVAETDDAERERRRQTLHEPYRTLLGHFRHEIGHYYWDRLVGTTRRLDAFRATFGDERSDYAQALQNHYASGPPADWQQRFVTPYASSHPWEDWAETWAHYIHVMDTLETAAACGLSIRPRRSDEPSLPHIPPAGCVPAGSFDELIESWFPLTYVLNNLNRGLGLPDGYPFVLSSNAIDKMRFVHDTIASASQRRERRAVARDPKTGPVPTSAPSNPRQRV
jgi:hypothetical protein